MYKGYKSDMKEFKDLYRFEHMVLTDDTLNDLEKMAVRQCIEKMRKGRSDQMIAKLTSR